MTSNALGWIGVALLAIAAVTAVACSGETFSGSAQAATPVQPSQRIELPDQDTAAVWAEEYPTLGERCVFVESYAHSTVTASCISTYH